MSLPLSQILVTAVLFVIIFASGIGLSRSDKQYSVVLLTIHKLISLGALIFLLLFLYHIHKNTGLGSMLMSLGIVVAICFIAAIVSGGLLSPNHDLPNVVLRLHQIASVLALFSTVATFYVWAANP